VFIDYFRKYLRTYNLTERCSSKDQQSRTKVASSTLTQPLVETNDLVSNTLSESQLSVSDRPSSEPTTTLVTTPLGKIPPATTSRATSPSKMNWSAASTSPRIDKHKNPKFAFTIVIISSILFVFVISLQIRGLAAAVEANMNPQLPNVYWCSPIFQPFGIAVLDGNCNFHSIYQNVHKGIGCIDIQGTQQNEWLKWTVAGTSITLVIEAIDALILLLVNSKYKQWRDVKMKRPWFTMISGIGVLIIILIVGYFNAMNLPGDITERVLVVVDERNPFLCVGTITPAGLRGAIIGWTDGIFNSWGTDYYGPWVSY
jgi:hypothetical protein